MNKAIVRKPARNLSEGLTTVDLGRPDYATAIKQHRAYCTALEKCGLELFVMEADEAFPDSTFVEDTAVLTKRCAIISRPGAASRVGEGDPIERVLRQSFTEVERIEEPGTLDGGDICETRNHFFIGISERTNEAGAEQLSRLLGALGHTTSLIDIRDVDGLLHLKSGLAALSDTRLVVTEELASRQEFAGYELIRVAAEERYAANCVRVNDRVLIASGYSKLAATLMDLGYQTIQLEMSEFQKLDGGLSCLSLRF